MAGSMDRMDGQSDDEGEGGREGGRAAIEWTRDTNYGNVVSPSIRPRSVRLQLSRAAGKTRLIRRANE